jgi:hypothetical protein
MVYNSSMFSDDDQRMTEPFSTFNSKTFADQLNTAFSAQLPEASVPLELIEVAEKPAPANTEVFTLHFRGPIRPFLQQRTYSFQHDKLGAFELFITAIGQDQQSIIYEAVFHRAPKL